MFSLCILWSPRLWLAFSNPKGRYLQPPHQISSAEERAVIKRAAVGVDRLRVRSEDGRAKLLGRHTRRRHPKQLVAAMQQDVVPKPKRWRPRRPRTPPRFRRCRLPASARPAPRCHWRPTARGPRWPRWNITAARAEVPISSHWPSGIIASLPNCRPNRSFVVSMTRAALANTAPGRQRRDAGFGDPHALVHVDECVPIRIEMLGLNEVW